MMALGARHSCRNKFVTELGIVAVGVYMEDLLGGGWGLVRVWACEAAEVGLKTTETIPLKRVNLIRSNGEKETHSSSE